MRHPNILQRDRAALVVVDVQERLVPAIPESDAWLPNIARLAQAAAILRLPVLVTEQYPRGLGATVSAVNDALGDHRRIEKLAFSACGDEGCLETLGEWESRQVLVCGLEAHVCVQQTVLDLLQHGYQVHLAADAVASRTPMNRDLGLDKMRRAGAIVTSTEIALFEMLERADTEEFKAVQALVK